jgi:hypothetical protein
MREKVEYSVSIGFILKSVSLIMNTLKLLKHLSNYSISLSVKDGELITVAEKPVPNAISATISTHEKQLVSYLTSDTSGFLADEPEKNVEPPDPVLELATELCGHSNVSHEKHLHLPPPLLHSLMVWIVAYHELCILRPNGLTRNARPEHVTEALGAYPWGVVYRADLYLLLTWGAPPESALEGLHDLVTGELLIPDRVAA